MAPASQIYSSMYSEQVFIPGTSYIYRVQHRIMEGDCQCDHGPRFVTVPDFYIDRYSVTNLQFQKFLEESGYWPEDDSNFLKHWVDKVPPLGKEHHPVIWVSQRDAEAYASHYGSRLASEIEWQLAAGGVQKLKWPWGMAFLADRCHAAGIDTQPVDAYPDGVSPYGCLDMSGNTWEWVSDVVDDEQHRFTFLRGGSYYKAQHTWHAEGGPHPTDFHLKFQLLNEGLNRCETVGFRCVKEANHDTNR